MRSVRLSLLALFVSASAAFAQPSYPNGSRIGLIPPDGMVESKRFSGFENPAKAASITVVEMPAEAFGQLVGGLTKEALGRQGITLTAREDLSLGDKPAVLVTGDQKAAGTKFRKWLLAVSDPTTTALIVAQTRDENGYSEAEMQAALKSVNLRAPLSVDEQIAGLPFRLVDRAGFRPVRAVSGNTLFLTDGPLDVVKAMEQPVLIVASSFAPPPAAGEAREQFARAALASNQTVKGIAVERSQSFRLKGQDWHEIVARGTDSASGQPIVLMQTIRFWHGQYLRMVGLTRAEMRDRDLPRFRAVIDSIEMD